MNTSLEDRLRADMARFTQDVYVRPGLAVAAARHARRRRARLRVAIAAGTVATLAAGAVTAAGLTGAFVSAATTPIQTTAYVLKQVDKALAPAGVASLISVSRTLDTPGERIKPFEGGPAGALPGLSPAWTVTSTMTWAYQGTSKLSYYGPAGQLVFDVKLSTSPSAVTQTTVVYRDRTWWTAAWSLAPLRGRPVLSGYRTDGWPGIIQYELSVHVFRVAGHQVVDGTDAIKLVTASGSATMWVNPATYLPVRYDVHGSQTDYQWLTPTAAHLALLDLPVPAGFTRVPPAQQ
jgi:hypothetical protein